MNLEQQKKQARELLRELRAGNTEAIERLRRYHQRWLRADTPTIRQRIALHDAQFVLAREQGFASWPKLKAHAEPAAESRHTKIFVADPAWLNERALGLLRTRYSAGPAALEQIREWHPAFSDRSDAEILQAPFTEADARLVYAREHGFETWEDLTLRAQALAANPEQEPFLTAFTELQSGDLPQFEARLQSNSSLGQQRGTNGNTLLNLAVSLAKDNTAAVEILLPLSDVNAANDRGWTPLHAAAYGNKSEIAALLLASGAALDAEAHGAGGTPLIAALFWGHRETADLLGQHSTSPHNQRAAAGLGLPDLVETCLRNPDQAAAARGFYRPHSGFPDWQPSNDPQEILDEALVWACKSNRVAVLDLLRNAGGNLASDPYRGTPLIWAAACNSLEAANWLLDHGADIDQKATFGGLTHGQGITALNIAAQSGHLPMVQLLVERGADLAVTDDLYNATALRAARHFGQTAIADYLAARA